MSETRPAYYQDQQCRKNNKYDKFQLGNEREGEWERDKRFKFRVIRLKDKISGRPYHCKVYNDIALCALNLQFVFV